VDEAVVFGNIEGGADGAGHRLPGYAVTAEHRLKFFEEPSTARPAAVASASESSEPARGYLP
jgi:hypothetical protein